jgi:hypothetical protein
LRRVQNISGQPNRLTSRQTVELARVSDKGAGRSEGQTTFTVGQSI